MAKTVTMSKKCSALYEDGVNDGLVRPPREASPLRRDSECEECSAYDGCPIVEEGELWARLLEVHESIWPKKSFNV